MASYDEAIPPGQVGHLTTTMDTKTLKGAVSKKMLVFVNDPARPRLSLTMRADVKASVEVLPQEVLYLRRRGDDESWEARGLIRRDPTERGTLRVADGRPSADWLDVEVTRLDKPVPRSPGVPPGLPGDYAVRVRFRGDAPMFGKRRETINFSTGLPREPRASFVVVSEIEAPVHLASERLVLTPGADGRAEGTMLISVRRGLDPRQLVTEADPPTLAVELEPSGDRMFQVRVVSPPGSSGAGRIDFRIGEEYARLPVSWTGPAAP